MRPLSRSSLAAPVLAVLAWALPVPDAPASAADATQPGPQPSGTRPLPSLANPASKHCADVGGRLEIVTTAKGETGICHFADGSSCEEWNLFRGRCAPPAAASAAPE